MSGDIPDVASYYLDEALEVLRSSDIPVMEIIKTLPPRLNYGVENKKFRVVATKRHEGGGVTLIVTPAFDVENFFVESRCI